MISISYTRYSYLILILAFISTGAKSQGLNTSVTFISESLEGSKIELSAWELDQGELFYEKFKLENNRYSTIVNSKSLAFGRVIIKGNFKQMLNFFVQPEDNVVIKAEIFEDIINYSVEGNEYNRDLSIWNESVEPYYENRMNSKFYRKRLDFVRTNPKSKFSVFLLVGDKNGYTRFPVDTLSKYAEYLTDNALDSYYGSLLKTRIANPSKSLVGMDLLGTPADTLISLSKHQGKHIVLDFWATWCRPCVKELPDFKAAHHKYADKVHFISVSVDSDRQKWESFIKSRKMTWEQQIINNKTVSKILGVDIFPTKFIIDPDGIITHIFRGEGPEFYQTLDDLMLDIVQN
jgi:peroxiredoxin